MTEIYLTKTAKPDVKSNLGLRKFPKFQNFQISLLHLNFYIFEFSKICMLDESSSRGLTPRATCSLVVPLLTSLNPYSYNSIVCIFNCPNQMS